MRGAPRHGASLNDTSAGRAGEAPLNGLPRGLPRFMLPRMLTGNGPSRFTRALLALAFLAVAPALGADGAPAVYGPPAVDGAVTVSDTQLKQGVDLSGDWELYWQRLLGPEEFQAGHGKADLGRVLVQVPGQWNTPGSGRPAEGWATYRLVVNLPEATSEPVGLYLKDVATAFRLFCNGTRLVENGTVSSQPGGTRGTYAPQAVFFSARDRLEIVVQVSNDEEVQSGIKTAPRLGYQSARSA